MSAVRRIIINLDILSEDMADALGASPNSVPDHYLTLLNQYRGTLEQLIEAMENMTESGARDMLDASHLGAMSPSKTLMTVLRKLIGYVLQFYQAHTRSLDILSDDFSDQADERLNLLQTRAIKAKSQFKTVAFAMGEQDYNHLKQLLPLPQEDWQWERLQLL